MTENKSTIYQVFTEGGTEIYIPPKFLGYATGNPVDIKQYYDSEKFYSIDVQPLIVPHITHEIALQRQSAALELRTLETRIQELKKEVRR